VIDEPWEDLSNTEKPDWQRGRRLPVKGGAKRPMTKGTMIKLMSFLSCIYIYIYILLVSVVL
jgi:hypothetical protein